MEDKDKLVLIQFSKYNNRFINASDIASLWYGKDTKFDISKKTVVFENEWKLNIVYKGGAHIELGRISWSDLEKFLIFTGIQSTERELKND